MLELTRAGSMIQSSVLTGESCFLRSQNLKTTATTQMPGSTVLKAMSPVGEVD